MKQYILRLPTIDDPNIQAQLQAYRTYNPLTTLDHSDAPVSLEVAYERYIAHTLLKTGLDRETYLSTQENAFRSLQQRVHETAEQHGWWPTPGHPDHYTNKFPEFIALCHSELSEALEDFRNHRLLRETYYSLNTGKPEGIPSELADVVIRIMDYCEGMGIDLYHAILEKNIYNEKRPYRHGNKRV